MAPTSPLTVRLRIGLLFVGVLLAGLAASTGFAADYCTQTAQAMFVACRHEVLDDYWVAVGKCRNVIDAQDRARCYRDAKATRHEEKALCKEQRVARRDACAVLGEDRYDPLIDPAQFVDPTLIGTSVTPNPYFPLIPGRSWVYQNGTETVTVTVTGETKVLLGVTCAVIHDLATDSGEIIEDTKDWYAQDVDGNVWYFGEISQQFENGELVSLEGSWTAGVEGAKPGIIMPAAPQVGDTYRQEFALGDAEDLAEILSLTGSETVPAESCGGDCLVTRDFTPLVPDLVEHKYFKPGVGQILAVDLETGEREELVSWSDAP
jgi:hypothetical protein